MQVIKVSLIKYLVVEEELWWNITSISACRVLKSVSKNDLGSKVGDSSVGGGTIF